MTNYELFSRNLHTLLALKREIVGIKLVYSQEEFDQYAGIEVVNPISHCVSVLSASKGHALKVKREMGGCAGGNRALGLIECSPDHWAGISGCALGLYKDTQVASKVAHDQPICANETYGIIVKPLYMFEKDPDVVLIFANTRETMRLAQGYTYLHGLDTNIRMTGNQAVCVEATVRPLKNRDMNISLLCSGTRYKAKWGDDELLTGMPFEMVPSIIEGLKGTVNAIEEDARKKEIEEGLTQTASLDFKVRYGKTYYKTWYE